ncbi:MAG: undecaprenyl-phosphate glucose phosphotransferase [Hyphomicrobiaceae bacterium]
MSEVETTNLLGIGTRNNEPGLNAKSKSRRIAVDLVGFADVLAIIAGGVLPAYIYDTWGNLPIDWLKHLQMCLVSAIIVYGCLRHFNMYDEQRMHDFPIEPRHIALSLGIAFAAMLGMGIPFAPKAAHLWIWYAVWSSTSFMLLLTIRTLANRILAGMTAAGQFNARVAVFGNGAVARRVEEHLRNPALGITFGGLFDDRVDAARLDASGPQLAGKLADLVNAARSGTIDRIIIALPQAADMRIIHIANKLERLPVSLHVVTHIASDLVDTRPRHQVSNIGSVGLIDIKEKPLADWKRVVKQAEDYVLGVILMIALLPVMLAIALAIRLDSAGPVFYRQKRRGLNHRPFDMFKFRTMTVLETEHDLQQAVRDDPRVTRFGRFLRRHSLDELPQLLNIRRGEMSLVGPRPHAIKHDDEFGAMIARYENRQQVKPGITGLAQINGFRGGTEDPESVHQRLAMDLRYVDNWSLWLDLKIMFQTIGSVLTGKNAY